MNTHKIGTDTYAVFKKSENESLLMVHLIWGKKDFRLFLERPKNASSTHNPPLIMLSESGQKYKLSRLQYLYDFEWYEFEKVSGHGLAHDEIKWRKGKEIRYLELPKDFVEVTMQIAALEFGMESKDPYADF